MTAASWERSMSRNARKCADFHGAWDSRDSLYQSFVCTRIRETLDLLVPPVLKALEPFRHILSSVLDVSRRTTSEGRRVPA
jgi:hypothetical protein